MYRSSTPASSSSGGTYVIPAATQISRPQVREFRRTRRQWDLHPGIFTEAGSPFLPSGMVTTGGREGGKDLDRDKGGDEGKQMVPRSDLRTVAKGQQQRHFDVSDDLEDSSSSQHSGSEEQKKSFQCTVTSWPSCRNYQFESWNKTWAKPIIHRMTPVKPQMSVASGYTGDYQHPCNRTQPQTGCIICSKDTEMAAKVKKQWWILWALHQQLQGSTNNNRESRWVSWSNVANHLLCKLLSAVFLARFFPPRFKICQRCRKKLTISFRKSWISLFLLSLTTTLDRSTSISTHTSWSLHCHYCIIELWLEL